MSDSEKNFNTNAQQKQDNEPAQCDVGQTIQTKGQKTDTVVISMEDVQENDMCEINHEKHKNYPKTAGNQHKPTTKHTDQKPKYETVELNIEDLTKLNYATEINKTNQDIDTIEFALTKNKHNALREELERKWVFMYQQPQQPLSNQQHPAYPLYPPYQQNPPYPQYPPYQQNPRYPQYPPTWQYSHPMFEQGIQVYAMFRRKEPAGDPIDYEDGNRNEFVRKVFIICGVMLLFTVGFVAVAVLVEEVKLFFRTLAGLILFAIAVVGHFIISYVYCCSRCASTVPCNYLLNVAETLCYSYIAAFIASRYAPMIVFGAMLTTLAVTLLCLGLAYTSFDFTRFLLIVIVAGFALCFVGIVTVIIVKALGVSLTTVRIVILVIGAVLNSVMLIIEFQMILGGKSEEIGEEDYTYAAWSIYTSIVTLFIQLVQLIGIAGD